MIEAHKMNDLLDSMGLVSLCKDEIKEHWNLVIKEDNGQVINRLLFGGPKKQLYKFLSNYAKNNKNKKMSGLLECGHEKESFEVNQGNVTFKLCG